MTALLLELSDDLYDPIKQQALFGFLISLEKSDLSQNLRDCRGKF